MAHPAITNRTPFYFEPLGINDEELRPQLLTLLKASFRIQVGSTSSLIPLSEQIALKSAGELFENGEISSYKFEPEVTPCKLSTDIVLIADAQPPDANLESFDAERKVGNCVQRALVFGERQWLESTDGMRIGVKGPAEKTPLEFSNAFGGVDTTCDLNGVNPVEHRNPAGVGYHHKSGKPVVGSPLPKIEDPASLIKNYFDAPNPIGFGFTGPEWQQRSSFAGTYYAGWEANRKPMLPIDFDARFYNSAAQG